jgi:hypothetical protein
MQESNSRSCKTLAKKKNSINFRDTGMGETI